MIMQIICKRIIAGRRSSEKQRKGFGKEVADGVLKTDLKTDLKTEKKIDTGERIGFELVWTIRNVRKVV